MNPTVSVVMPTFNRANCIKESIDSALAQTSECFEIVVVDDGSSDNTRAVVEAFGARVRYVFQENSGVSAARNAGVEIALGEWIAFLDSDDEWRSDKLEKQLLGLAQYPDLIALVCDAVIMNGNGTYQLFELRGSADLMGRFNRIDRPLCSVIRGNYVLPSLMVRRDVLVSSGGFSTALSLYEDLDLMARVALLGAWGVVGEPLVRVARKTPDGLSDQHSVDLAVTPKALVGVYERLRHMEGLQRLEKNEVRSRLSDHHFSLAAIALRSDCGESSLRHFYLSFVVRPSISRLVKIGLVLVVGPRKYEQLAGYVGRRGGRRFRRSQLPGVESD